MVSVPDKTGLLHPVVGRPSTGGIVRVVQQAEVLRTFPWTLEGNKSCGLRFTFDLPRGMKGARDAYCGGLLVHNCVSR